MKTPHIPCPADLFLLNEYVGLHSNIGRFLQFLLNIGVTPLFSAAYKSFTNPHIEGHNSTFTQKLWSRYSFTSLEEIDRECERFNAESRHCYEWKFKE